MSDWFMVHTAHRHSLAAFGEKKWAKPFADSRATGVYTPTSQALTPTPPTAANVDALESIERTNRCVAAADRMAQRFRLAP